MVKGWVSLEEALRLNPDFQPGWKYDPSSHRFDSRFGFAEQRVQLDAEGKLAFDRVVYGEAPNINAVVWGRRDGQIYIGRTVQSRPFADHHDGEPADPAITFVQPCVMGFNLERVAGTEAALREASEEAGTGNAVLSIKQMRFHNPNPTFCATWSELFEIEVDLDKIEEASDRSELIYRAEFVPLSQAIDDIARGWEDGVSYRSATANDTLFVWLAKHWYGLMWRIFSDYLNVIDEYADQIEAEESEALKQGFSRSDW